MESDETNDEVSGNELASVFWRRVGFGPSNRAKSFGRAPDAAACPCLLGPSPNVEYGMMVPHLDKERSRSRF